jgi:hypothetical protein
MAQHLPSRLYLIGLFFLPFAGRVQAVLCVPHGGGPIVWAHDMDTLRTGLCNHACQDRGIGREPAALFVGGRCHVSLGQGGATASAHGGPFGVDVRVPGRLLWAHFECFPDVNLDTHMDLASLEWNEDDMYLA